MVSKQRYHNDDYRPEGAPPPMDESWWEAVLAEDESYTSLTAARSPLPLTQYASSPLKGASREIDSVDWDLANDLYQNDQVVDLNVGGYNRGGLLVSGDGLQGFVPISHLIDMQVEKDDPEDWLADYVGRQLSLKVIECDRERGRVVFSERAALASPGSRNHLLHELQVGDCVYGTVTNVTDFGVFVDLGGVEGLIHVSEISWGRVRHPSDVVQLGKQVEVYVINVDKDRARVGLSLKRLHPNPWETAEDRYHCGQIIEAVITSVVQFGAFARLEEGLDGLIHISEMCPDTPLATPADIVYEGQRVRVRVLHVNGSRQRLGLSMNLSQAA